MVEQDQTITLTFDELTRLIDLRAKDIVHKEIIRLDILSLPLFCHRNGMKPLPRHELDDFMIKFDRLKKIKLVTRLL
jgi:hypothetical protein